MDEPPEAALAAFLRAHALPEAVPAVLLAQGEALYERLAPHPPAIPEWGRFLVALGQLAADLAEDPVTASRYFLRAVADLPRHTALAAAVTAGYNQGVLFERSGRTPHARAAYAASAELGLAHAPPEPAALRATLALARLDLAAEEALPERSAGLLKQAWLAWLVWSGPALPMDLTEELQRALCAFLLPEDDPLLLAHRWRSWPPPTSPAAPGSSDGDMRVLQALFAHSAVAADRFLRDEGPDPGAPYRLLGESLARQRTESETPAP